MFLLQVEPISVVQVEAISLMEVIYFNESYPFQWQQLHCFSGNHFSLLEAIFIVEDIPLNRSHSL